MSVDLNDLFDEEKDKEEQDYRKFKKEEEVKKRKEDIKNIKSSNDLLKEYLNLSNERKDKEDVKTKGKKNKKKVIHNNNEEIDLSTFKIKEGYEDNLLPIDLPDDFSHAVDSDAIDWKLIGIFISLIIVLSVICVQFF